MNQGVKNLLALLLILGGLGFSGLTIGGFAHQNENLGFPLTLIRDLEGAISTGLRFLNDDPALPAAAKAEQRLAVHAFSRGFTYMGLAIVLTSVAAMLVSSTRRDSVPVPGRRKGA
jgi:hypothetical protein